MSAPLSRLGFVSFILVLLLATGCGSKISEANYYRVHHGMTEKEVEDLLGPAHEEQVVPPAATGPSDAPATAPVRKVKTWRRESLTIRVTFEDGVVVARSADGIPAEAGPASQPLRT